MAAFAVLFSTYLWSLVVSQDNEACVAEQCAFNGGSSDVGSMVQLNVAQSISTCTPGGGLCLAGLGQSCADACPQFGCDLALIGSVNAAGLNQLQPFLNCGDIFALNPPAVSLNNGGGCTFQQTDSQTNQPVAFTCEEGPPFVVDNVVRVCACLADPGPGVAGDPHIHSMRGAHYTLLQEGIFVAWNFSKAVPAVPAVPGAAPTARGWELLAAYAGNRFTTQGLMLLDRHSGKSMEITAEDCTWRVKEKSSWRKAQLELLTAEDGSTSFQVKKLHEKLVEAKVLRSAILLKMAESGSDMKNMARLVVHCRPNYHLDFKMSMFQKSDINHVGGELGVAPDANHNYHFLFSKHGMMQMRADQEFKAAGSWVALGGSPAGSAYLEKKHQEGTSLVQTQGCGDAQDKSARAICAKHIKETLHPQMFLDCVFDICHGGDESFAETAAAFLLPLDESNA